MQYRIVFLAALTATGAFARPALRRDDHQDNQQQPDNQEIPSAPEGGFADIDFNQYECPTAQAGAQSLTIDLRGPSELASRTELKSDNGKFVFCPEDVFSEITVELPADLTDLRCAVADEEGKMIGATRGANVDFTFTGGEAGKWDFLLTPGENGIKTSKVVCDPAFKKIDPAQREVEEAVYVLLREQKGSDEKDALTIGPFKGPFFGPEAVEEERLPVEQGKTFETLEVKVGRLTNPQALRCAAVNNNTGRSPFATRGENLDNTFADAKKGEWTFARLNGNANPASKIKEIRCDKDFVANNRNAPVETDDDMPTSRK